MQNQLSAISFNLREMLWKNEGLRLEVKERKNGYAWDKQKLEIVEKKLAEVSGVILIVNEMIQEIEEIVVDTQITGTNDSGHHSLPDNSLPHTNKQD